MKPAPHSLIAGVVPVLAAAYMATAAYANPPEMIVTDGDRQHWSYVPLQSPHVPAVEGTASNHTPVDRFIMAKLAGKEIAAAPPAGAQKLVRRIHFDLIGLPPAPEQVEAFVQAHERDANSAVASLVDELLARPQYGERWARHWLDVVRYADSDGHESDHDRPTAWYFRDFVIRSLNDDLAWDTFVRWQIAGDEFEPDNPQAIAATGFIVAGPHIELGDNLMEEERNRTRFNELDDMIATTGSAMLGLTLGCARCHDHKYDPVPRRDYYRMLCAFNSGDRAEVPLAPLEEARRYREAEAKWKAGVEAAKKQKDDKAVKAAEARKPGGPPTALAFADFDGKPRETFLLARGDFRAKGEPVELGFLTALSRGRAPEDYWKAARGVSRRPDSSQQRRAMAEWMTDLEHGAGALVARVIVNRVWQHHFGQGLVRTVNDFGKRCDPPTHPELLEWLTSEFVKGGWKLKPLHRLIMTSGVYRQDTTFDVAKAAADPDHRLLWRRRPLRIESEILRDAMLSVSGTLNSKMFGPAVKGPIVPEAIQARNVKDPYPTDVRDTPDTQRRSIYMFHKRVVQPPLMQAFDGPDAQASCGRRENTTVAPQALALLNDKFVRARSMDFARRVEKEAGPETEAQVRAAWRLALCREPAAAELKSATDFLGAQRQQRATREPGKPESETHQLALADFCQAIFALNEFIYVD